MSTARIVWQMSTDKAQDAYVNGVYYATVMPTITKRWHIGFAGEPCGVHHTKTLRQAKALVEDAVSKALVRGEL